MGNTVEINSKVIDGIIVSALEGEDTDVELPSLYTKPSLPVQTWQIPSGKDVDSWEHLRGISLPKVDSNIDLLIGNNAPAAYAPREVRTGPQGSPYATKTPLGWVAWGVMKSEDSNTSSCTTLERMYIESLNFDFPEKGIDDKRKWSAEDRRFMKIMDDSCKLVDGHYQLDLPLRDSTIQLPDNLQMAKNRLKGLQKKIEKNPGFREDYVKFMEDVISKGFAEEVPSEDTPKKGRVWYIPHHGVYHPQKKKIRVVFDCAAKFMGTSLNDVLLAGPNLMNSLQGVLMRFRQHPVAFAGDIETMFYQVKVPVEQRDLLRFLWWPNGDLSRQPGIYRKTVHLFGAVSSPSCANYGLQRTAFDNACDASTRAVGAVRRDFYMDDVLKSVETVEEAMQLVKEQKTLCKTGGFNLTKWSSNRREVLQDIPKEDRAKELRDLDLDASELPTERTLGILWSPEVDEFQFCSVLREVETTRRVMLSVVSAIYDPLGFIAPLIIPAKMILQEMCRKKVSWDDTPDKNTLDKWNQWMQNVRDLGKIRINRCYVPDGFGNVVHRALHAFSDASELSYGTAIYLRSTNEREEVHVSLVFAKARVVPLKKITIPRLELTAATLSVKMVHVVTRELDLKIARTMYWTDSTAVLRYIANEQARYLTFVANRVQLIREATNSSQWHHVGTKDNPADLASRGVKRTQDLVNSIWFGGADFLWKSESEWPRDVLIGLDVEDSEVRTSCVTQRAETESAVDGLMSRFSSWKKMKRVMAWVLMAKEKFLAKIRITASCDADGNRGSNPRQPTVEMLNRAEDVILKRVQSNFFEKEIKEMQAGNKVTRSSLLFKLNPMIGEGGLLRVGGRINNADVSYDVKHPVFLPKNSIIAEVIIRDVHREIGHLGKNAIVARLRERYWLFGAAQLAKKVARECVTCRHYQAKTCEQMMADLPANRVQAEGAPFEHVGVDYFGPFMTRRGRSEVKRYRVIFTCMSSRAAHLEVAHSLDTDSCINSIRRFMARRGPVRTIRSDNGTNLVGAEKELREMLEKMDQTKMTEILSNVGIDWSFNPPAASHFGGVWERLIRSTRKILYAIMRDEAHSQDDEALTTIFCEAENILNNRPLTATSTDPDDMMPLTPNMLINPRGRVLNSPGVFLSTDTYSRKRWRRVQHLVDVFWYRWRKEYLVTLQQRAKWQRQRRNVAVGDVVLIVEASVPRNHWMMAVVETVFADKNGDVRSCRVKTKSSVLERPVAKLCILVESN